MGCNAKSSAAIFGISKIPQTNYDTPLVPTDTPENYLQVNKQGDDFFNYEVEKEDDAEYSTGNDFAQNEYIISHDVNGAWTERASSQGLARRLYAAMGKVTTVALGGGAYQHTFQMIDPSACVDLPAWTIVEKAGEPTLLADVMHDVLYPSQTAESLQLNGDGKGFLEMITNWRGSGKRHPRNADVDAAAAWVASNAYAADAEFKATDPDDGYLKLYKVPAGGLTSGASFDSAEKNKYILVGTDTIKFFDPNKEVVAHDDQTHNFFRNTSSVLKIYPQAAFAGTVETIKCNFRSMNLGINSNNLQDDGYLGCGKYQDTQNDESGAVRGSLPVGKQAIEYSTTVLLEKTLKPMDKLQKNTYISLEQSYTGKEIASSGFKHSVTVKLSKISYTAVSLPSVNSLLAWNLNFKPLASGNVLPLEIVVVNDIADLTAV